MPKLNPYFSFNSNCREAMTFYKECLGGELAFMPVKDTPVASQLPPHLQDSILHCTLTTPNFEIMATDMTPEALKDGNATHLCLGFTDEQEMRKLFEKLSEGGTVNQPLNEMFFGLIGTLTDKYGKRWILECDKP